MEWIEVYLVQCMFTFCKMTHIKIRELTGRVGLGKIVQKLGNFFKQSTNKLTILIDTYAQLYLSWYLFPVGQYLQA